MFPVITHEGSGLAGAPAALKKYCKGATVGEWLAVQGANVTKPESAIAGWAKKNLA